MTEVVPTPLQDAIRGLIRSYPRVRPFVGGHTKYVERYLIDGTIPLGHEVARKSFQNLWVRKADIDLGSLADIDHEVYDHRGFNESGPNSNLFAVPEFNGADLVCFRVRTRTDAARITDHIVGGTL
ncbi:MAG: hypothetical protein IT189_11030 [Microbacteriaceae bacterium]|nr:hypothetical protein [Microbacteriaceae bacterium]